MVLKLTLERIDRLIWPLIYGGLLTVGLGLALRRIDADGAGGVMLFGSIVAALGVVLIGVRARKLRNATAASDTSHHSS